MSISPSSNISTCIIIGRQQTLQSSVYSWRLTEVSMVTSTVSQQEGQVTNMPEFLVIEINQGLDGNVKVWVRA